jgi:glutamate decarboxylase
MALSHQQEHAKRREVRREHHWTTELPTTQIPERGLGLGDAYEYITAELLLDGRAQLNLATFVSTYMPAAARALMAETSDKNMIDKDEYPLTAAIEERCVNILAELWHSPESEDATGCSTTGSSEACMLAGMAMKWRWRKGMSDAGRPAGQPNLVMGANVQVCWEKFCRYWEVEPRLVPMEGDRFHLGAAEAVERCDENTIGVVAILGSTFDGSYEPVKDIADALERLESDKGWHIPLHVDAASGGFVAPFLQPDLEWDFRIPRVLSINASGHKYGMVYPGVGWAIWRTKDCLPRELVFEVNYLGGHMPTFALNFSRPGSQVIAQYLMLSGLGREGYTKTMRGAQEVAEHLSGAIEKLGPYNLISRGDELPVFAFTLKDGIENYTVFDVSDRLRQNGWLVPAYSFPENRQDLDALRIVIRPGMSHEMASLLIEDLMEQTEFLESLDAPLPGQKKQAFSHN